MSDQPQGSRAARRWSVALVAAVAAVALGWGVWAVVDDDPDASDASDASATPTATTASETSPKTSASPSPATVSPGAAVVPTDEPSAVATDAAGERTALDPVAPDEGARLSKAVSVRVVKTEGVTSKVVLPSDTKGPAIRVTIKVTNRAGKLLDTRFAVVNAYHGDQLTPANILSEPGGRALPTSIAPGKSATGVYLFDIDRRDRRNATLEVDLAPQLPVARFVGNFS